MCAYNCYSQSVSTFIYISATHEYTSQRQYKSVRVAVIEPVVPVPQTNTDPISYSKMEVICPDVVLPGTFFNCTTDVPKGQGLSAVITLTDDLTKANMTSTIKIPGKYKTSYVSKNIFVNTHCSMK